MAGATTPWGQLRWNPQSWKEPKLLSAALLACAAFCTIGSTVDAQAQEAARNGRPYLRPMDGPDQLDPQPGSPSPETQPPQRWQQPGQPWNEAPPPTFPTEEPAAPRTWKRPPATTWSPPPHPQAGQSGNAARKPAPAIGAPQAVPAPIAKDDLAPVLASDGSGLPVDLWTGLDLARVEKLLAELTIPPRSAAVHDLWRRLILSKAAPTGAGRAFEAVRLEALYRSGLVTETAEAPPAGDAVLMVLAARQELANARREKACELAKSVDLATSQLPKRVKAQAVLLDGYCAAAAGDSAGAGLTAELAREEGQEPSAGLAALDAISIGAKPTLKIERHLSLLDYRLLEAAGAAPDSAALGIAEPALLVALASDATIAADVRLYAAESAARLNALSPEALAALYSALGRTGDRAQLLAAGQSSTPARRAALFKAIEATPQPVPKAQLMQALIEDARRNGLGFQTMRLLARSLAQLKPGPDLTFFVDSAAEIALAAREPQRVSSWVALSPRSTAHWLALADIADPALATRGEHLADLEALAVRGRFKPETLQRLATVLEALDYLVPIPLWDAANRTAAPTSGYLPETGVLPELQQASARKEFGHTILLTMMTLGPDGPEAANLIALGDSIRALKRAGLEAEARRLGLEALLGSWPRSLPNERS